jgi:tRNA-modifying protein YgfZ
MTPLLTGAAPLADLGVIAVKGEDAASFLQNQLTNDFSLLGMDQARLAAWCSAKGRMLASFIGLKHGADEVLLVASRDVLPQTLKRLSMFVLRAKAKLRDASAEFELTGLAGAAAQPFAAAQPWMLRREGGVACVTLYPADGTQRVLRVAPAGSPRGDWPPLDPEPLRWGEVRSGIATVTAPIAEAFVPQMLNYESVGGVNFKKGCYPGQEVVARSQFRGTLKRRAYLAHCPGEMNAGQELFVESDPAQPCGLVAAAAASPAGGFDAIVSVQVSAAGAGRIAAGSANGPAVALQPPPYPLLADI